VQGEGQHSAAAVGDAAGRLKAGFVESAATAKQAFGGIVAAITSVALPSPSARQLDGRAIKALKEGAFDLLQLDATAYPGNSGGPLFDAESGAVVGVVNMVALKGTRESALTHPSGISYAIPVEHVQRLLARNERK
jgi:hypothetical protein